MEHLLHVQLISMEWKQINKLFSNDLQIVLTQQIPPLWRLSKSVSYSLLCKIDVHKKFNIKYLQTKLPVCNLQSKLI